jgi:branched-chain amino acid transport system ATP-binding protein
MMLDCQDIHSYYDTAHILQGVSLCVGENEVVALLGRNGAGKTTTLKSIAGLVAPRKGKVVFKGQDVTGRAPHRISRAGVALVPETRGIFSYLTTRENLDIAVREGSRWSVNLVLERFPKLQELSGRPGRFLSGGEQQMLAIARALVTGPDLLLLDEPSQGLAPLVVETVIETIKQLKRESVSMILVEQNVQVATEITDRAYVLDQGRIVFAGTSAALRADTAVLSTYLGVG